jgi:lysozyme family protein
MRPGERDVREEHLNDITACDLASGPAQTVVGAHDWARESTQLRLKGYRVMGYGVSGDRVTAGKLRGNGGAPLFPQ